MKKLVPDTSVLIDYIVLKSPYRSLVTQLFEKASAGQLELYVNAVTLSETVYVASRVYRAAGMDDPNREAINFIEWVKSRIQVVGVDENVALLAGELKKQLHITLPDCYVIATAKVVNAVPLFRKPEEEMKPVIDDLRKLGVIFLNELMSSSL